MDISKEIIGEVKANCETEKCCDNPGCDGTKLKRTPHLDVINTEIQAAFEAGTFVGDESLNKLASGATAIALELQRDGHKLSGLATALAVGAGVTSMERSDSPMSRIARTFRRVAKSVSESGKLPKPQRNEKVEDELIAAAAAEMAEGAEV